ncbi:MAG: class I SAM-dependent methyltransferase [Phycisphaeraceae bacterium]
MTTPHLYDDLAHLWPKLSPPDDYAPEAEIINELLTQHFGDRQLHLLELGAGGGHTLFHLKHHHHCTASDLSESMLAQCRRLNSEVPTIPADMRTLSLDQIFDAILIHDAIDYLLTPEDLLLTFTAAANHLPVGGLLILAPDNTAETFDPSDTATDEQEDDHQTTRLTSTVSPLDANHTYDLHLTIEITDHQTARTTTHHDHHRCAAFPLDTWLKLLKQAGFTPHLPDTDLPWMLIAAVRR